MPVEGIELAPRDHILTFEEIERLTRLFVRLGVEKVRLTGGEPLVRKDVEYLVGRLALIPGLKHLSLTTNGILLADKLPALRRAGLSAVNISLDTLKPDRFEQITRRKGHERVMAGIKKALESGYRPLKINTVVMRGVNDDELPDFVAWTREHPVEIRFIEYMPFQGNGWDGGTMVPFAELVHRIRGIYPELIELEERPNDTAKRYRIAGFIGSLGFISSMTDHFCGSCNRLRLTADGHFKVCLFGRAEISLRDVIRSGAGDRELEEHIRSALFRKKWSHAGVEELSPSDSRPMILIGG